jgi:hypothetical protein
LLGGSDRSNVESQYGLVSDWDVSSVTDFSSVFKDTAFNEAIEGWNTVSALNMKEMFMSN